MANLEDTVRSVVQDFIGRDVLFTALDVSNTVKQALPHARHREVRDTVRSMFATDIESKNWARTPITVNLEDGSTAEALLYHPLTDSWDLDNKYSSQQRSVTAFRPVVAAAVAVAAVQTQSVPAPQPTPAPVAVTAPVLAPASTVLPTARGMWDNLFQTQPSLFPSR
jgi:hypothetical protein